MAIQALDPLAVTVASETDKGLGPFAPLLVNEFRDGAIGQVATHSHSHTHSHAHTHTHSHTYTYRCTVTHTYTHIHTHTLTHSLTHSRTHSLTHSLTHSHTHGQTTARPGADNTITVTFSSVATIFADSFTRVTLTGERLSTSAQRL